MALYSVANPYPVILSQTGTGLNGGKVYIGVAGQDPETNPVPVYWDAAGTDVAAQPLSTIGGYIVRAGSPAQVFGPADYSIRVRDRFGVQVFYSQSVNDRLVGFMNDLASSAGAGLVGFSHAETYSNGTVGKKLQQTIDPLDAPYSATGDGVANDRAALLAADADGPIHLTPGLYYVGSNLTLNNPVTVEPGARLVIPNGVTITCNGGIEAGEYQIANLSGTGNLGGLAEAKASWFFRDLMSLPGLPLSGTACDTLLQKAFDALVEGGRLRDCPWVRRKGVVNINMRGASYIGNGADFRWASSITEGVTASPTTTPASTEVGGFTMQPLTPGTIPTAGTAFVMNRSDVSVSSIRVQDPYNGFNCTGGVSNTYEDFFIYNALQYGVRVTSIDQFFADFVIQALSDWITLSGVTGTFNVGDVVNVAGSVGNITEKFSATAFRMFFNDVEPTAGMAIASSSGGAATISGATIGHQLGGFRTEGPVEALVVDDGECLGGLYSLTVASYSGTVGRSGNLAYSRFKSGFYCDSSYRGAQIQGAYGCQFENWFANSRKPNAYGVYFELCGESNIRAQAVANSGYGILVSDTCMGLDFSFSQFNGNCRNYAGDPKMAELNLAGPIQRITVTNIKIGFMGTNGITPPLAIYTDAAASDYLKFGFIQAPAAKITWQSTGANNRRVAVDGLADL